MTDDNQDNKTQDPAADDPSSPAEQKSQTAAEKLDRGGPSLSGRSVSLRSILIGAVAVLVIGAMAVMGWQWWSASDEVDQLKTTSANNAEAEKVALDYAKGAANMSFEDPEDWRGRLVAGTSPELSERLRQASTQMEQLLRPLQWSSTSQPIAAKVESVDGDVYQVVAFVNVRTTNVQAPSGIESTATYRVTMDKSQDWLITAISSTGSNLDGEGEADNPGAGIPNGTPPAPGGAPAGAPAPAGTPTPGN
ncbi:hypothetical protein [Gordonia terrae]